jgi:folate-binding protein YgfZ
MIEASYYQIQNFHLLEIKGRDAERYLHNRLTQDIKNLKDSTYAMALSPQGKIEGSFLVHRDNERFLLLAENYSEEQWQQVQAALLRFKVADNFTVTKLSQYKLISVIDSKYNDSIVREFKELISLNSKRATTPSYDLLVPESDYSAVIETFQAHSMLAGDTASLERLRIEAGVPAAISELNEETTATEIPFENYISFTKGCYAGQEVVEMSTARGHPNRKLVKLQGHGEPAAAQQLLDAQLLESRAGKVCGKITSASGNIALGFLKYKNLNQNSVFTESNDELIIEQIG